MAAINTRLLDNTAAQDGWRLLRFDASADDALAIGHWIQLAGTEAEAAVALYRFHADECWWATLVPPDHRLAPLRRGATFTIRGIHGTPLPEPDGDTLLLGAGQGIGPILALAEAATEPPRLVCLGDASGLPVRTCPSRFVVPQLPAEVMAGVAPLEAAGVVARVAVPGERPGCYDGDTSELLRAYLAGITETDSVAPTTLIAATPWRTLAAQHEALANRFERLTLLELPAASDARPR